MILSLYFNNHSLLEEQLNINILRSYANLLSNSTFERLVRWDDYRYVQSKVKLYEKTNHVKSNFTYGDYFSYIFDNLKRNYRVEYVYKNYLVADLLIKKYGVDTTTAINEFRIGRSIADLVLLNGTSKVFEIKTELDNTKRLVNQIIDYKKVFKEVYLVTHFSLEQKYLDSIPSDIGLMVLTEDFFFRTVREPLESSSLDSMTMIKCLRKSEYSNVIRSWYGELPKVTDFKYFSTCLELFQRIPLLELHDLVINELKHRMILEKEIFVSSMVPYELKYICFCLNFTKIEYKKLQMILQRKLT